MWMSLWGKAISMPASPMLFHFVIAQIIFRNNKRPDLRAAFARGVCARRLRAAFARILAEWYHFGMHGSRLDWRVIAPVSSWKL